MHCPPDLFRSKRLHTPEPSLQPSSGESPDENSHDRTPRDALYIFHAPCPGGHGLWYAVNPMPIRPAQNEPRS